MYQIQQDKLNYFEKEIDNPNRKITYKFSLNDEPLQSNQIMDNIILTTDTGLEQYGVGCALVTQLQMSVKSDVSIIPNDKIAIEIGLDIYNEFLEQWETLYSPLGVFYVDTIEEKGSKKSIKAYDGMFKLNKGYFPSAKHTTTQDIANDIVTTNGYKVKGIENVSINNEQLEGKTCLEMLSLIASAIGGHVRISRDASTIEFVTPSNGGLVFTEGDYTTPTVDDATSYNITKLRINYSDKVTDDEGVVTDSGYYEVGEGTDAQTLAISNPLLKGKSQQAQIILDKVKRLNGYKRFDTSMPLGDFRLEPMDFITYIKGEKEYIVPILYMKTTLSYKGISIETQSPTLAESKSEFSFKGTLSQKVENIYTDIIQVKQLTANKVTTDELEATVAKIEELYATKAEIGDLVAGVIDVEELKAQIAEIDKAIINKADIEDLNATNATINSLKATVAEIDNLIADSILSEIIQSGSVSSDLLNVKDGFIKDAMISSLSASKIETGVINTNNVTIQSDNGNMLLQGNLLQFKDKNNKVRIQIGQDTSGNYTFTLYDATGQGVLINQDGVQSSNAIKDGLIVDSKVSDNANISGSKLNISSVYDEMNADGSKTLKASKVMLDEQNQTLDVSFKEMTTKQDELEESMSTAITDISVAQGQISQLIQNTTITTSEGTTTIKDAYSKLEQNVEGISASVGKVESTIDAHTGEISNVKSDMSAIKSDLGKIELSISSVEKNVEDNYYTKNQTDSAIKATSDSITQSVSSTYATKTELSSANNDISDLATRVSTAEQKITSDAIVSTVTSSKEYTDAMTGKVNKTEVISSINQTSEEVKIDANKISLNGKVVVEAINNGTTEIDGKNIATGTLSADKITTGTIRADLVKVQVDGKENILPFNYVTFKSGIESWLNIDETNEGIPYAEMDMPIYQGGGSNSYFCRKFGSSTVYLEPNTRYFFSCDIYADVPRDGVETYGVGGSTGTGAELTLMTAMNERYVTEGRYVPILVIDSLALKTVDGQWTHIAYEFTTPTESEFYSLSNHMYIELNGSNYSTGSYGYIQIANMALEKAVEGQVTASTFDYLTQLKERRIDLSDDKFYHTRLSVDGFSTEEGVIEGKTSTDGHDYKLNYDGLNVYKSPRERYFVGKDKAYYSYTAGSSGVISGHSDIYGVGGVHLNANDEYAGYRGIFTGVHYGYQIPNSTAFGRPDIYVHNGEWGLDFEEWQLLGDIIEPRGLVRRDDSKNITTNHQLKFLVGGGTNTANVWNQEQYNTTGNGQMLTYSAGKVFVSNPKTPLVLESSVTPSVKIGSDVEHQIFHTGYVPKSGNWWNGGVVRVSGDGVAEVGKYIDFHSSNDTTADFTSRITDNEGTIETSGGFKANRAIYTQHCRVAVQASHGGLDLGNTDRNTAILSANVPTWWNGVGSYRIYNEGFQQTSTSDIRYKRALSPINTDSCYDMVKNININSYLLLDEGIEDEYEVDRAFLRATQEEGISRKLQMGVIAQDLLKYDFGQYVVVQDVIRDEETGEITNDKYSIDAYNYASAILGGLQKEIQIRDEQYEELKQENEELKNELDEVKNELAEIKQMLMQSLGQE